VIVDTFEQTYSSGMCYQSFLASHLFSFSYTLILLQTTCCCRCLLALGVGRFYGLMLSAKLFSAVTGQRCIELNWSGGWLDGYLSIRPEWNLSFGLCVPELKRACSPESIVDVCRDCRRVSLNAYRLSLYHRYFWVNEKLLFIIL